MGKPMSHHPKHSRKDAESIVQALQVWTGESLAHLEQDAEEQALQYGHDQAGLTYGLPQESET